MESGKNFAEDGEIRGKKMVVLILENVPTGLRGELSRWMLQPRSGIFVGSVSGMVRDRLWEKACGDSKAAAVYDHDGSADKDL